MLDSVVKGSLINNDILENIFPMTGVRIKLYLELSCFIKKRGGTYILSAAISGFGAG
jgi:hypothetical protein